MNYARDDVYWREGLEGGNKDLRLMVKRTFITNSLGEDSLPKWASWLRVIVDGVFQPLRHLVFTHACVFS